MRVVRTVVLKSEKLPKKTFKTFVELGGMYREMLLQTTLFAVQNEINSFVKLKSEKYKSLRKLYLQLPSHYAYTVCQDSALRVPRGDGGTAPSPGGLVVDVDGGPVSLAPTATREAIRAEKSGWLRWNSLPLVQSDSGLYAMKR